jgi:predicted unusual protein kinase regulating ubiquinone biosynthesis (AarF/ABC1/UbiB family)
MKAATVFKPPNIIHSMVRNEIGERLFHVLCEEMYHLHALHCDSHPGNFAFRPDGTLIMYDFGCVKRLNPILVADMKRLVEPH